MEIVEKRVCPVCGSVIVGRKDKMYCCDDCRSFYHNLKYREKRKIIKSNGDLEILNENAAFLFEKKSLVLLKFIVFLSGICKIISIFGIFMFKNKRDTNL